MSRGNASKIPLVILCGLLVLGGCADWHYDWKQSVHDALINICDMQRNCASS